MLPDGWKYSFASPEYKYLDICERIVSWSRDSFEMIVTGNRVADQAAFTDGNVFKRTEVGRRRFYSRAFYNAIGDQGLSWWGVDNYGTRNTPIAICDVESPEDRLAASKSDEQEGDAIKALVAGYDAIGFQVDAQCMVERAQRRGIKIVPKHANPNVAKLNLGVEAVAAAVTGRDARAYFGLPPFGDARDEETLAHLAKAGPAGGMPVPGQTSTPQAPIPPPAPDGAAPPPPAPAGASPPSDDEPADDMAARYAADLTAHGLDSCEHGSKNRCRLCGVERTRGIVVGPDGPQHAKGWRAISRPQTVAA